MAVEAILLTDGALHVSTADLRNSTNSGTTRMGPNGSGQFLAVKQSTVTGGVVYPTTLNGQTAYGVIQNKPGVGDVAAVAVFGLTKAVAGTTTITPALDLMVDTSGCMIPYATAANQARFARQAGPTLPTAVGEVFTVALYGIGQGPGIIA
jgi:hypothetical protein